MFLGRVAGTVAILAQGRFGSNDGRAFVQRAAEREHGPRGQRGRDVCVCARSAAMPPRSASESGDRSSGRRARRRSERRGKSASTARSRSPGAPPAAAPKRRSLSQGQQQAPVNALPACGGGTFTPTGANAQPVAVLDFRGKGNPIAGFGGKGAGAVGLPPPPPPPV